MSDLYCVELYDEREFASQFPQLKKKMEDRISQEANVDDFEFCQCMQTTHQPGPCISYFHDENEDLSAYAEFDSSGNIIEFEITED